MVFNWWNGGCDVCFYMFKSSQIVIAFLSIAVTLSGLWYSWHLFSDYQKRHANERASAAEFYYKTTRYGPDACRSIVGETGLIDWLTCLVDNVSADGSVKQSEYDLKAQQNMAAWAFGMLLVTVWLTLITLLGVFFVWRTLKATQKMAADSRIFGEATATSYLTVNWAEAAYHKDIDQILYTAVVSNSGASPAYNVTAEIVFSPQNISYPVGKRPFTSAQRLNFGDIPPKGAVERGAAFNLAGRLGNINDSHTIYPTITITWTDVFGWNKFVEITMLNPLGPDELYFEQGRKRFSISGTTFGQKKLRA